MPQLLKFLPVCRTHEHEVGCLSVREIRLFLLFLIDLLTDLGIYLLCLAYEVVDSVQCKIADLLKFLHEERRIHMEDGRDHFLITGEDRIEKGKT